MAATEGGAAPTLRKGDRILLHAEVMGFGDYGPLVRVEAGWGGAVYLTPARDAIALVSPSVAGSPGG